MTRVADLLLEGLAEGLILRTVERQPTGPSDLLDELGRLLGRTPERKQVFPVVHRLESDDLLRPSQAEEADRPDQPKVYRLSQAGARRLATYRALPEPFKRTTAELFELPSHGLPHRADTGWEGLEMVPEGWVQAALAQLPAAPEIQAPFARVSLDREPSSQSWTLRVEHHQPGAYDGAQACPLTFLYAAASRLLYTGPATSSVEGVPSVP